MHKTIWTGDLIYYTAVFLQKDVVTSFWIFYFYGFWGFLKCSFRWWYCFVLIIYRYSLKWSVKETYVTQKEYFILHKRCKIHIVRKKTHVKFNILQIAYVTFNLLQKEVFSHLTYCKKMQVTLKSLYCNVQHSIFVLCIVFLCHFVILTSIS